jgi:hypothetical protein
MSQLPHDFSIKRKPPACVQLIASQRIEQRDVRAPMPFAVSGSLFLTLPEG